MNLVRCHKPVHRYYHNDLMNDLFQQMWNTDCQVNNFVAKPASNIFETDENFRIELLVPGFEKNEIEIVVENDFLIVKSDYKDESKMEYTYSNIGFRKNAFEKRYKLSENINAEAIKAEFKNGILTITLPKQEEEKQKLVRKIEIV